VEKLFLPVSEVTVTLTSELAPVTHVPLLQVSVLDLPYVQHIFEAVASVVMWMVRPSLTLLPDAMLTVGLVTTGKIHLQEWSDHLNWRDAKCKD
jgi:hypothetical protein